MPQGYSNQKLKHFQPYDFWWFYLENINRFVIACKIIEKHWTVNGLWIYNHISGI